MAEKSFPGQFWHCKVEFPDGRYRVANDLTFSQLERTILGPWRAGRDFVLEGQIVRPGRTTVELTIVHTSEPQRVIQQDHEDEMDVRGTTDLATDPQELPLRRGTDHTEELLAPASE